MFEKQPTFNVIKNCEPYTVEYYHELRHQQQEEKLSLVSIIANAQFIVLVPAFFTIHSWWYSNDVFVSTLGFVALGIVPILVAICELDAVLYSYLVFFNILQVKPNNGSS